jgi:hypothetical protein
MYLLIFMFLDSIKEGKNVGALFIVGYLKERKHLVDLVTGGRTPMNLYIVCLSCETLAKIHLP